WEDIQSGTPAGLNSGFRLLGDPRIGAAKTRANFFNSCTLFADGTTHQPNTTFSGNQACSNPVWQQINSSAGELASMPFQSGYIRNPNAPIGNLSASKKFKFTETINGQFRFEAFNFTNTYVPNG